MSFWCANGVRHQHNTSQESRRCWQGGPVVPYTPPPVTPAPRRMATESQLYYIERHLGGDPVYAAKLTLSECSAYIDKLKRERKMSGSTTGAPVVDPKLEFAKTMLASVADGYYAVRKEEGASIFFLRVSHPKSGTFKDAVPKVQRVLGTASTKPRLEDALAIWPSGRYSFYGRYRQAHHRESLIEAVMLLVVDTWGASRLYSQEIGRCCRCNAALTDERSRHYGIGPECEKYWPHILEAVDAEDALAAGSK